MFVCEDGHTDTQAALVAQRIVRSSTLRVSVVSCARNSAYARFAGLSPWNGSYHNVYQRGSSRLGLFCLDPLVKGPAEGVQTREMALPG